MGDGICVGGDERPPRERFSSAEVRQTSAAVIVWAVMEEPRGAACFGVGDSRSWSVDVQLSRPIGSRALIEYNGPYQFRYIVLPPRGRDSADAWCCLSGAIEGSRRRPSTWDLRATGSPVTCATSRNARGVSSRSQNGDKACIARTNALPCVESRSGYISPRTSQTSHATAASPARHARAAKPRRRRPRESRVGTSPRRRRTSQTTHAMKATVLTIAVASVIAMKCNRGRSAPLDNVRKRTHPRGVRVGLGAWPAGGTLGSGEDSRQEPLLGRQELDPN